MSTVSLLCGLLDKRQSPKTVLSLKVMPESAMIDNALLNYTGINDTTDLKNELFVVTRFLCFVLHSEMYSHLSIVGFEIASMLMLKLLH